VTSIPESYHDLFERQTFAHVATVMPDGTPQVTPVWVDYDTGRDRLLVNTARGRQKERNLAANPKVGVSMLDPEDAYRWCSVRGEVTAITEDGAVEHIDELARRYMDVEEYPNHDAEDTPRVIIEIRPDSVVTG
jgi:PPOX class probable F420-dependent enzyme